jgi:hypothetical protein
MVVIDRVYAGGAVQTTSATAFTPTVPGAGATFTVADDTGFPASGKFIVKLNRGLSDEEKVLVDSRAGTTFTVNTRGYDGTTAQAHTNPTVEHALDATAINQMVQHVDDVEADPHSTKLLNNARHDITARHTFGAALGTPGTPTALTPDIAGSAGVGSVPARSDHVHNVPAATASSISGTNSEGASASFARADHNHAASGSNWFPGAAIVNDSITATQIAASAVGASELADNAVDTAAIIDLAVTLPKIGFGDPVDNTGAQTFDGTFSPDQVYSHYYKFGRLVLLFCGMRAQNGVIADIAVNLPFTANNTFRGLAAVRGIRSGGGLATGLGVIVPTESKAKNFATLNASSSSFWGSGVPIAWTANSTFDFICIYIANA